MFSKLKNMKREMVLLVVRHALSAVGVFLVASGILTKDDSEEFTQHAATLADVLPIAIGAIMGLVSLGWSAKRKMDRAPKATPVRPLVGPPSKR